MLLIVVLLATTFNRREGGAHAIGGVTLAIFVVASFALLVLGEKWVSDVYGVSDVYARALVVREIALVLFATALAATVALVIWRVPIVGADAAASDAARPWLLATAYVAAGRLAFAWTLSTVPVVHAADVLDCWSKRIFDIVVASALLLFTAPLTAVVAAAIWLDDRGPIFYRSPRFGAGGRKLEVLKFRKMRHGVDGGSRLTSADDERFTRIGQFLARTRLDELPQLWNVVRGEMSLVGPRPEDPEFVAMYEAEFAQISGVRPGITGLCQLAFAKEAEIIDGHDRVRMYVEHYLPQKLAIDRLYVEHRTFLLDLKIMLWTAIVLVRKDVAVHRQTGELTLRRRRREDATSRAA